MFAEAFAVLARVGHAPLVGRESERALLASRLEAASAPPGAVIAISGEPGAGKTRLAAEATAGAVARGARALTLRCYHETSALPYAPFRSLDASLPALAALLADVPAAAGARDAEGARLGLFERVDQLLLDHAGDATAVLMVDDLQWADEAAIDLLRHLARRGRRGRRALILTIRSGESAASSPAGQLLADLQREGTLLDLPLAPLTESGCQVLLSALLGDVDPALAAAVYRRTEGVPFFVEELVRLLVVDGTLMPRGESARLTLGAPSRIIRSVPAGVAATVLRRVAQLPAETREALHAASALGAAFSLAELAPVLGQPVSAVVEDLAPAVAARVIRVRGTADGEYAFAHELQRDAIYAELPPDRRRALHRRAAQVLSPSSSPVKSVSWAVVAFHAEHAREWQLAYEASVAAGDEAVRSLAGVVALAHFRRARDLAAAGHVPLTPAEETSLNQRIVSALLSVGHLDESVREAKVLIAHAEAQDDRSLEAWAWVRIGQAETFAHHLSAAREALERARALAEDLGDESLLAAALSGMSVLLDKYGYLDEAEAAMRRAMPLAEKLGDLASILGGLDYLGYAATWRGEFDAAVAHFSAAFTLAERAHDVFSVAVIRFGLALAEGGRGHYEAALDSLHKLLDFAAETGAPYYAARAPNTIGWIYRELELFDRAREWDERAVVESFGADWPGHFEARANSLLNLATDLILLGRLDEAHEALQRAVDATNGDEFMRWRNANRVALVGGELALARGEAPAALEAVESALAQAEPKRASKYIALALDLAGRAHASQGRLEEAMAQLERAAAISGASSYGARWRILAHLAATIERAKHPQEAQQRRAEAATIADDIAARLTDPDLRAAFLATPDVAALRASIAADGAARSTAAPAHPARLTSREVEILRLVAGGRSNREIATALVISERTVNSHLVHIFNKLQVNSRAAAATQALRLGLAD